MGAGPCLVAVMLLLGACPSVAAQAWELRVCAETNSLPFSDRQEQGFDNHIAKLIAEELDAELSFVWLPQPRNPIRDAMLETGACDLLLGVPDGIAGLLTTIPYYRSSYVFVYREDSPFEITSFDDPALEELKVGVQSPGGEAVGPGTYALLKRGLLANQVTFVPDPLESEPLATVIEAVVASDVDVAVVWGPIAGYFSARQDAALELIAVRPEIEQPFLPMVYTVSIGVRQGDMDLRDLLNTAIANRWQEIQEVLASYHVPLIPIPGPPQAP
jgi:mxaJ protein